ncbi:CBN-EEF-1B.1 protein [Caenorhabditis brenneri]|uniref:CBN-EEF-1B.1 protein n=1 Tax=Caenorhabditis brenneri TaxID=135651 RepID=G0N3G8_CAEBE|nr:CBN-EEF-1B.1 protein [Caenorhabditis brenneri]
MVADVKSPAGLAAFNTTLAEQAFATGFVLSGEDAQLFAALGSAPKACTYPNVARWYANIASYTDAERKTWASAGGSAPAAAAAEGDDFDLFGSEDEEEDEAKKKLVEERLAAYAEKKSKKAGPIAKSSVILDVKPWDDETDLGEMEKLVRGIEMDGLVWGGAKLIPIGYGIKKLQIITVIEDLKVSVDDLIEKITGDFEDHVQSVDIVAFNKI